MFTQEKFIVACLYRAVNKVTYYTINSKLQVEEIELTDSVNYPMFPVCLFQASLNKDKFVLYSKNISVELDAANQTFFIKMGNKILTQDEIFSYGLQEFDPSPIAFQVKHTIRFLDDKCYTRKVMYRAHGDTVICSDVSFKETTDIKSVFTKALLSVVTVDIPYIFDSIGASECTYSCNVRGCYVSFDCNNMLTFSYDNISFFKTPLDCYLRLHDKVSELEKHMIH